jgi:hypothetical protein
MPGIIGSFAGTGLKESSQPYANLGWKDRTEWRAVNFNCLEVLQPQMSWL